MTEVNMASYTAEHLLTSKCQFMLAACTYIHNGRLS